MADDEPAELGDLLKRSSVRNLLISRASASSGAVTLAIAMGVFVFDITDRKADIGFVGLAEFLPTFLLVLWAGSLADRLDRRRMAAAAPASTPQVGWATMKTRGSRTISRPTTNFCRLPPESDRAACSTPAVRTSNCLTICSAIRAAAPRRRNPKRDSGSVARPVR